jgi:hypothetical protein
MIKAINKNGGETTIGGFFNDVEEEKEYQKMCKDTRYTKVWRQ